MGLGDDNDVAVMVDVLNASCREETLNQKDTA